MESDDKSSTYSDGEVDSKRIVQHEAEDHHNIENLPTCQPAAISCKRRANKLRSIAIELKTSKASCLVCAAVY